MTYNEKKSLYESIMTDVAKIIKLHINETDNKLITIYEVLYSFIDSKYNLGPYFEYIPELKVKSTDYDEIVKTIENSVENLKNIKLSRFCKTKPKFKKPKNGFKSIKYVMFSYIDKKYNLGPYVELLTQLDVPDFEYDSIVSAIEKLDSNYKDIKILSYEKITKNDYLK